MQRGAQKPGQPMMMRSQGGGVSKRKPEESLQRESKRHGGPEFDRLVKDLRTLLENKCLPIAQRCKEEGLTEMVR